MAGLAIAGGLIAGGISEALANEQKKKERKKIDEAIQRIEQDRNSLESERLNTMESFINQYAMTMDPRISQNILNQYSSAQNRYGQREAQLSQKETQLELSKPSVQSPLEAFGSGVLSAGIPVAGQYIGKELTGTGLASDSFSKSANKKETIDTSGLNIDTLINTPKKEQENFYNTLFS